MNVNKESFPPPQISLDKQQLIACLLNLFNGNPNIIQEANSYLMDMEANNSFLIILLEIFETECNMDLKNQAFLVFKNAFKRRFLLCKPKFPEDPLKNEIKSKLIEYMQLLKMNSFLSKSIKSCILDLVETEFPLSYKALVFYLKNGFEQLSTRINENPMSFMDSQSLTFLKEVHRIFKTRRQAKNFQKIPETQFREFFESILQSSYSIMTLISNNFENAKSNPKPDIIISFLTVSQLNDEICLMILQYINTDSHLDEIFKTIVELMFQKCSILIQTLLEDPKKLPNEMKKLLNKNLKGILYNFSKLQNGLPFLFFPHLQQYVELIKFILDNNHSFSDERILKSGLIAFYKLLKTFAYFADSQSYSRSLRKTEKDIQEKINFQLNVLQNINTLFTDQTLEQLLFSILQNILIREFNKQKNEENLENLIELDNDDILEDSLNEFENSVYNLTLVTTETLFQRFPNICFNKLNNLTNQLISLKSANDIEKPIQDGIFAILGVIPKVFMKLKIEKSPVEYIEILKVLEFLKSNLAIDALYARRFASLTMKWMNVLNEQVLNTISDLIYQILLNFNHHLIQYESIKCLHEIIKSRKISLNYQDMLLNVIPIIIDLIEKFNNPIIISPLIEFLNNLLEKTRYSCPEVLAFAIQNPSFKKLLQNDSEILRNAICDMFKSLIASFCTSQHISNIVIVALDFIDQSFQLNLQYEGGFLMLWLLISKEFNPGEKDVALIAMNNLYKKYLKKILCWRQENDMEIIVEILEENMLISFEEIDNNYIWLIKFIEEKYEFSNKMTHPEYTLTLKISILSLFASLLLKIYNQKQEMDFKVFENIISMIIFDLLRPNWLETSKKFHSYRTSLLTLMNRFLIKHPLNILEILRNNEKVEEFVGSWIYSMKEISSGNACKINLIAVFSAINFLEGTQNFFALFEILVENLLLNYSSCLKYNGQNETNVENTLNINKLADAHTGISKRKELLRKTNLFNEFEIKNLFITNMQDILYKRNYKQFIKNPQILEKLSVFNL